MVSFKLTTSFDDNKEIANIDHNAMFHNIFIFKHDLVPEENRDEFRKKLLKENLSKTKVVAWLGVFFSFLLICIDILRFFDGAFINNGLAVVDAVNHVWLAFTIFPALASLRMNSDENEVSYQEMNRLILASLFIVVSAILVMAFINFYRRNTLTLYGILVFIMNLIFILDFKLKVYLNILASVPILLLIMLVESNTLMNMLIYLVEALGFLIPSFIISANHYNARLKQFLNEKKLESNSLLIEEVLVENFNKKVSEIEMNAMRAQMNPHFLFNCLNSIKYVIVQNDAKTAAAYLTKFARLIRLILNNSKSRMVTLADEIDALRLYVDMEQFRFSHAFKVTFIVDAELAVEAVEIPPMILQPYIENAIQHGLRPKPKGEGHLKIELKKIDKGVLFLIEDNGVGRALSESLRKNRSSKHKSFGTEITLDRIKLINEIYKTDAQVMIFDLKDDLSQPVGTKVLVQLPLFKKK